MTLLRHLGFQRLTFMKAVDGKALQQAGGRERKMSNSCRRLSYDWGNERKVHFLRSNRLGNAGISDVWAQLGCALSHCNALTAAKEELLAGAKAVFIFEDDLLLQCEGSFKTKFHTIWQELTGKYPNWFFLQLGGTPVYSNCHKNGRSKVRFVNHATNVFQLHSYVLRNAEGIIGFIDAVIEKIELGYIADNATTAIMKLYKNKCFWCSPNLIETLLAYR